MPSKFIIEIPRAPDMGRDEYLALAKLKLNELASLGYFLPGQVGFRENQWELQVEVEHGLNSPPMPRGVRRQS